MQTNCPAPHLDRNMLQSWNRTAKRDNGFHINGLSSSNYDYVLIMN